MIRNKIHNQKFIAILIKVLKPILENNIFIYLILLNKYYDQHILTTVLYLLSRNLMGGLQNLKNKSIIKNDNFFPAISLLCWATVMFLYADDKSALQPSLTSSMNFLYTGLIYHLKRFNFIQINLRSPRKLILLF